LITCKRTPLHKRKKKGSQEGRFDRERGGSGAFVAGGDQTILYVSNDRQWRRAKKKPKAYSGLKKKKRWGDKNAVQHEMN